MSFATNNTPRIPLPLVDLIVNPLSFQARETINATGNDAILSLASAY